MKRVLQFLAALPVAVLTGALVGWGIDTWWANALNVDLAEPADWGDDERDWLNLNLTHDGSEITTS